MLQSAFFNAIKAENPIKPTFLRLGIESPECAVDLQGTAHTRHTARKMRFYSVGGRTNNVAMSFHLVNDRVAGLFLESELGDRVRYAQQFRRRQRYVG
jgi:hypothetical protein